MWNSIACNPSYEKFLRKKELQRFKSSLIRIGPQLEISKPKKPLDLRIRSKKTQIKDDMVRSIETHNKKLLQKIIYIGRTPSHLNKTKLMPRENSQGTLNLKNRIETQCKIMVENKKMLERLQGTHSFYSTEKWENDFQYHEWIKSTHCKTLSKSEKKEIPDSKDTLNHTFNPKLVLDFDQIKTNFYRNYDIQ